MYRGLVSLILVVLSSVAAAQDKDLSLATQFAKEHCKHAWVGSTFKGIQLIESANLKRLFPQLKFYAITVFNPESVIAGPPTLAHTLMLQREKPALLDGQPGTCKLLSDRKDSCTSVQDAISVALAFAELCNYKVRSTPNVPTDANLDEWTLVAARQDASWSVTYTVEYDPHIKACRRINITIDSKGTVSVKPIKHVGHAFGGYR